jgi:membrane-bound serine protease (ClpP class)
MPVAGMVLFLFLPWKAAVPIYLLLLILSVFLYVKTYQAMKVPVSTGIEGMIGEEGIAVKSFNHSGFIKCHGEIWKAESDRKISVGDRVRVIGTRGLVVLVRKQD